MSFPAGSICKYDSVLLPQSWSCFKMLDWDKILARDKRSSLFWGRKKVCKSECRMLRVVKKIKEDDNCGLGSKFEGDESLASSLASSLALSLVSSLASRL